MRVDPLLPLLVAGLLTWGCAGGGNNNGGSPLRGVFFKTNQLVVDPVTGKLWASTPGAAGARGNKIVQIDPKAGRAFGDIAVGSEPAHIALSSDGQTMWVSLTGQAAIQRVNLVSGTVDPPIGLGSRPDFGFIYPASIQVVPGAPNSVVLCRVDAGLDRDIAVYDAGVVRPNVTGNLLVFPAIRYGLDDANLYGLDSEHGTYFRLAIDANGVTEQDVTSGQFIGTPNVAQGKLYVNDGTVRDATTGAVLHDFGAPCEAILPVVSRNRLYLIESNQLVVFDLTTFAQLQTIPIPDTAAEDLVPWGASGLAFRNPTRIFFIDSTS
ncbi:MAG: YncE family protein [Fimbriimonadales bacterium]